MSSDMTTMRLGSRFSGRVHLIDYISPDTEICASEFALLFGSRHAQAELVDAALELFHSGYFGTLIVAGGKTRGHMVSEASEIAQLLISAGLSKTRIILEENSQNTGENVRYTRDIVKNRGIRELLLIGKLYAFVLCS